MNRITAYLRLAEFDRRLLPSEERNFEGELLAASIGRFLRIYFSDLPGKTDYEISDRFIKIRYYPDLPGLDDEVRLSKAEESLTEGRFEDARGMLEFLAERYPENSLILYNLGLCLSKQSDLVGAVTFLERATQATPFFVEAHTLLSRIYIELGDLEKAKKHAEVAVLYGGENLALLRDLGGIYLLTGELEKSDLCYRNLLKADERDPLGWMGVAEVALKKGKYAEALSCLERIVSMDAEERIKDRARAYLKKIQDEHGDSRGRG